ncbi:endonuclease/exonuclease/phosphatase family protein [Amycolatopsis minnesotensis]|uniref:Endonuclease/exonuclease/phosphatase domain-containing protein n=1 Tax=Amycolatopsis minnesotensis TaxID=337894 RepID=A0ABN2S9P5_9PSEU
MITMVSVNAYNLYGSTDPDQQARFRRLEALIRDIDADVVAVQEVVARDPEQPSGKSKAEAAARAVRHLADAVDRHCDAEGAPVLALGGGIHHTALLWRAGIEVVPGTVGRFQRDNAGMWHSLVTAVFDLGGTKVRVGSVQLSPFDQAWGWSDANQILRAMHRDGIPGLLGGDFNGIGAQQVATGDGDRWYDLNPYIYHGKFAIPWHPDHAYQFDDKGELDRRVARRLENVGRMRDCALITDTPWQATTGHHPADQHPRRRIDRWYATHHLPDNAVKAIRVLGQDQVGASTDHLPVEVDLDTDAVAAATAS